MSPCLRADVFFFFQAEDGIRDYKVTGVQTCALPICPLCQVTLQEREQPPQERRHRETAHRQQDDVQPSRGYAVVYGDPDQLRRRQARRRSQQQRYKGQARLALVRTQIQERAADGVEATSEARLPGGGTAAAASFQPCYPSFWVVCFGRTKTTTRSSPGLWFRYGYTPRYFSDIELMKSRSGSSSTRSTTPLTSR